MKIKLFFCFILILFLEQATFSQHSFLLEEVYREVVVSPNEIPNEPCSQSNIDTEYLLFPSIWHSSQLIANDLYVNPNEIFTLNQITVALFSINGIENIDVIIWSDNGGVPGSIIFSDLAIIPTSQTFITTNQQGNVYETVIDLNNPFAMNGNSTGTTYWVQLMGHANGGGVGWHATKNSIEGYHLAYNHGMGWNQETHPEDGVYLFSGECDTTLAVNDKIASSVTIYPNPTKGLITFAISNTIEILDYNLYTLTGRRIVVDLRENVMDLSNLPDGLYIAYLKTSDGTFTKKIIKE